jgi:crotonobetainyl-CoA:carnitine CoA-transferase CaiB-like acyl-CoA transferase
LSGPLDDVRVLEVANFLAAPACAALMADMGAEVIKVEPPGGDAFRGRRSTDPAHVNPRFEVDNRGKRSIALALDAPGAAEVVLRLAERADVFITNLVPARLERFGLTFEAVRTANPGIVYTLLTGYGATGPDASRTAYDSNAFWARSGVMSLMGQVGTPPVESRPGQGDHPTSLNLLASTLAALRMRERTGEAQFVDVSLLRTGIWSIAADLELALNDPTWAPNQQDRARQWLLIHRAYELADGRSVQLTMSQVPRYWPRFCAALDRPAWADDPRYCTTEALEANGTELIEEVEAIFRSAGLAEWARQLDEHGLIWAPMATLHEVARDPQLRENGAFERVWRADGVSYELIAAPFRISGADVRMRGPAPSAGEHTQEVLSELGLTEEEIAALASGGAFG